MRIPEGLVGTAVGPLVQEIDARWLMAYAAALGDVHAEYLDTTRPDGVIGHPIFPVCYEWPLAVELRASAISESIAVRSVHATHDLRLHRRARAGDRLSTTATVISSEPRAPGAYVVTRLETVDAAGRPVSTTDYGSIYRGVECERSVLPPRVAELSDSKGDAGGRACSRAPERRGHRQRQRRGTVQDDVGQAGGPGDGFVRVDGIPDPRALSIGMGETRRDGQLHRPVAS